MQGIIKNARSLLYLLVLLSYLAWEFTGLFTLRHIFGFLLLLLIGQAIAGSSLTYKLAALVLFSLGTACLVATGAHWLDWMVALTNNGGLVALFIVLPLFSFLLAYEDYSGAIEEFFNKFIRSGAVFNILALWLSFILGAILNVAANILLYSLLKDNAGKYGASRGFSQALVRGQVAGVFWAPNFMSVAIVLTYVKITWLELAPLGFFLSCLFMCIASGAYFFTAGQKERQSIKEEFVEKDFSWQPFLKLLLVYAGLIAMVAFFNLFTTLQILTIVSLTALLYPFLAAVLDGKMHIYRSEFKNYYQGSLPKIRNEILLFASVGFFGKALDITGAGVWLSHHLPLAQIGSPHLTVVVLIAFMSLVALLGIHPIVTISALATTLGQEALGLSVRAFAYTLLLGYGSAVVVSPFSALSLVMAGLTGETPWNAVPRINFFFIMAVVLFFSLLLPFT